MSDSKLSKNYPHIFSFDGVECASLQSLLQAFKFKNPEVQEYVCKHVGIFAKRRAKKRNKVWKEQQKLWWKDLAYNRDSAEYQKLIERVFEALSKNQDFRNALLATDNEPLVCTQIRPIKRSVLSGNEFCVQLAIVREKLHAETHRKATQPKKEGYVG